MAVGKQLANILYYLNIIETFFFSSKQVTEGFDFAQLSSCSEICMCSHVPKALESLIQSAHIMPCLVYHNHPMNEWINTYTTI